MFFLFFCFTACQSGGEAPPETATLPEAKGMVLQREVSLYDRPDGTPFLQLPAGARVELTGQISDRLYYRTTQRDTLLEPYLGLRLPDGRNAWVYGHPNNFVLSTTSASSWQWDNRLHSLLNETQRQRYRQVWQQWEQADQAGLLLLTYQATRQLREELEVALRNYPSLPAQQYEQLLPGTWSHLFNGRPGWWIDYNQWAERAAQMAGAEAEVAIFRFYQTQVYPPDGIEFYATSWEFPVNTVEKHSLLGRGLHLQLLQDLQELIRRHPFLAAECDHLKDQLLNDICTSGVTYWESWPAVEMELDSLLSLEWTLLTHTDLARLQLRKEELALPNFQELYLGRRER